MANITAQLDDLLKTRKTHCSLHPLTANSTKDEFLKEGYRIADHISSLRSYLLSIRQAYLSTASAPPRHHHKSGSKHQLRSPPSQSPSLINSAHGRKPSGQIDDPPTFLTNNARDAIDSEVKALLRDLNFSLRQLSSAESLRRQTWRQIHDRKYRKGFLERWAAGASSTADDAIDANGAAGQGRGGGGGKSEEQRMEEGVEDTLAAFREGVIWYLGRKLEAAAEIQRDMVERRVKREVEKGRSVLYLSSSAALSSSAKNEAGSSPQAPTQSSILLEEEEEEKATAREKRTSSRSNNSDNNTTAFPSTKNPPNEMLLQTLEAENTLLSSKYHNASLSALHKAESSILEIAALQSRLVDELSVQSTSISQLVTDSADTTDNVAGGNKQLKRAAERKSVARMVFWASVTMCSVLIGWDLIF